MQLKKVILLLGITFIMILGAVIYYITHNATNDKMATNSNGKKSVAIKEVKPTLANKVKVKTLPTKPSEGISEDELRAKLKTLTKEERVELAMAMRKQQPIDLTPTTNRPFRTGIEISIAKIFTTRLGDMPPPIYTTFTPIHDMVHLETILTAANPELESDSEKVKNTKQVVQEVKKEMLQFVKDGGKPEEFLSYYHEKLRSAFEERQMAIKEVVRVAREEPDIAHDYYESLNKRLIDKGIRGLEFSEKAKEKLGLD